MDFAHETENLGFSFIWSTENFSFCLQKRGEALQSPAFVADTLDKTSWKLALYPRGDTDSDENYIGFFLERQLDHGPESITLDYQLSIYDCGGTVTNMEAKNVTFRKQERFGLPSFASQDEVYGCKGPGFLSKDTLTVGCRIWRSTAKISESRRCSARTRMRVKYITLFWTVDNFSALQENQKKTVRVEPISENNPTFVINLFYTSGLFSKDRICVEISQNDYHERNFCICRIFVLDVNGIIAHYEQDQHLFEDEKQYWYFPLLISRNRMLAKKRRYLFNDGLNLRFDFSICDGVKFNEVEYTYYVSSASQTKGDNNNQSDAKIAISQLSESLKDDLQCLYSETKFCDSTLQTENTSYPVHKPILDLWSSTPCLSGT